MCLSQTVKGGYLPPFMISVCFMWLYKPQICFNLFTTIPSKYELPKAPCESTWPAIVLVQVDPVNGHGYDGQQEDAICNVCGLWQTIQSTFKPVFRWFRLIGYAYELLRCLDLKIWWFSWWQQTDRQMDYFIPVHVHGVMKLVKSWYHQLHCPGVRYSSPALWCQVNKICGCLALVVNYHSRSTAMCWVPVIEPDSKPTHSEHAWFTDCFIYTSKNLDSQGSYAHVQRAHGPISRCGQQA